MDVGTDPLSHGSGPEGDRSDLLVEVGLPDTGARDAELGGSLDEVEHRILVRHADDDDVVGELEPLVGELTVITIELECRVNGLGHLKADGDVFPHCDVELVAGADVEVLHTDR